MANKTIVDLETDLVKPYIDTKAITIEKNLAPAENGTTAVGNYAIGEQFVRGDKLYKAKTAITAGDTLTLNTNYEAADDITTQVTSLKEDLADYKDRMGTINLLQNTMSSYTLFSSVQIVVDSDGIISTRNTSTGGVAITINSFTLDGNHKISGCPSGGSSSSYCFQLMENDTYLSVYDTGSGVEYDFDGTKTYALVLVIRSGVNTNGLVFKPMITTADTPNSDYAHFVPYAKTNRQLTEDSVDWNDLSQVGAVNFAQNNLTTQTITTTGASLTLTVDDDKQITLNGEVSANQYLTLDNDLSRLIGKPIKVYDVNGFDEKSYVYVSYEYNGNMYYLPMSMGTFVIPSGATNIKFTLVIYTGKTFSNFKISPMVVPADYNGDYVPYAKTNKELTENIVYLTGNQINTGGLPCSRYFEWQVGETTRRLTLTANRGRKTMLLISNQNIAFIYFDEANAPIIVKVNGFTNLTVTLVSGSLASHGTAIYDITGLTAWADNVLVDWSFWYYSTTGIGYFDTFTVSAIPTT